LDTNEAGRRYHIIADLDLAFNMVPIVKKNFPMPFLDLSTYPGGVAIAFQYEGQFYVRAVSNDEHDSMKWKNGFGVASKELRPFVFYRIGDEYQVMTIEGQRYQLSERGLTAVDANGKALATAPSSQPAQTKPAVKSEIAMVVDRTGEKPVAYRLVWRDGALHPFPDDTDKAHAQVAVAATTGIDVLATAPSIPLLQKMELQRRELERQWLRQEENLNRGTTKPGAP
jgi:hypothetical protein